MGKIKKNLKYLRKRWSFGYSLFFSNFEKPILAISVVLDTLAAVTSVLCLVALTIYAGYDLKAADKQSILTVLRIYQGIFAFCIIYDWTFRFKITVRQSRFIKWAVDIALLITLLPLIYPIPANPWIPWLKDLLYSNKLLLSVLAAYSIVDICYAVSRIPNRRTNPSILMAGSFLVFIIIGSFALMLPRCTYQGITYADSLFVSSSAVCITGLTSVDIPSTFTPFGILVISILVQLGSLGVITFTSFFALFFTGNTSIYNQLLLKDIIYSKSMNSLVPTLLYVLGFTLTMETAGALVIYFTIPDSLGFDLEQKLIFSGFHSMSSFCNAGFSCLPGGLSNPALLHSNQNIYVVTSVIIFAGAVGFPILVNFKEIVKAYLVRAWNAVRGRRGMTRCIHIFDLNTKLVLTTTLVVLAIGSVSFFLLERNNTLAGMTVYEQCVQSVFNSLVPRSAGFASVNPANFLSVTLLLVMVQMIIGGSSQSMAGGIKVNTLGVIVLNLKSVLYGHEGTSAFHRTVSVASVRRAHAVVAICSFALLGYLVALLLLEPELDPKAVVFETISALFTVGSSLGITGELSNASKILLCTAMFFGRVGLLSILCGIMRHKRDVSTHFPTDNVIIN